MLTISDIVHAAILAVPVTLIVIMATRLFKIIVVNSSELNYNKADVVSVTSHFEGLFPMDMVMFHGRIFKRGTKIRLVTLGHKSYEGKLIGQNHRNIVCILTEDFVVAHSLDNISEISVIEA